LETDQGACLHGLVDLPEMPGPRPAVVVCHGFKGFMEWGFFPPLAELLAERGFAVVRFNFSGTGMDPGDELVTRPEDFRRATFSKDVAELLQVLEAAGTLIAPGRIDRERLALLGHSRGGATAVIAAARDPWRTRLRALVTWAAVATFARHGEHRELWRRQGFLPVTNARTGQELEIGLEVLDDLERHRDQLDPIRAARARRAPWLIVHGADDESVSLQEGRDLAAVAALPSAFEIVPQTGHTFGAVHPFAGPTPALIQAMNATVAWLRRNTAGPT